MRISRILMASVAAVTFSSYAVAADLVQPDFQEPSAPAVSEIPSNGGANVGICDVAGAGFFTIPGSATCLKIGGAVEAQYGYLQLKDSLGGVKLPKVDGSAYGVQARFDFDTHTDSDFGPVTSKVRASFSYDYAAYLVPTDNDEFGIELAYVKVGPAFLGYTETLANTQFGYGEVFDAENYISGGLNTLSAGFLVEDLGGGVYAGAAIENFRRGNYIQSEAFNSHLTPDFVARLGLANQPWGNTDLTVVYSDEADVWGLKSTTDYKVMEGTQVRLSGAYFDIQDEDAYLISGGVKYDFAENISGYAGIGYGDVKDSVNGYLANLGVVFTPAEGFDITGELGYAQIKDVVPTSKTDAYTGLIKFVRSW